MHPIASVPDVSAEAASPSKAVVPVGPARWPNDPCKLRKGAVLPADTWRVDEERRFGRHKAAPPRVPVTGRP